MRLSSDPALTPMRIETPASLAARAIAPTWSSNLRMLPGLTRTAAQPASIAAKTYLGWKWMSAMTGMLECLAISGSASASSWLGQATRTMSQPAAVSSAICCSVVLTSDVRVVVIDCTEMGASPPTSTLPTLILRVLRRGASTGGGMAGSPRSVMSSAQFHGVDDVGVDQDHTHQHKEATHGVRDRQHLGDVDVSGVRLAPEPGESAAHRLVEFAGDVAA